MKTFALSLIFFAVFGTANAQTYHAFVAAESEDEIGLISFDSKTSKAELAKVFQVGVYPTEIDGPHGITVSPDGKYVYVSIAHGNPYGVLQKIDTETGEILAQTTLGLFPASMDYSAATGFIYVVNFNLHGEMEPSTFSVVDSESMEVLTEVETGIMPHGSRLTKDGTRYYHVSMMTDELFEIDALTFEVSSIFNLVTQEVSIPKPMETNHAMHHDMGHTMGQSEASSSKESQSMHHNPVAKPTWVHPHPSKKRVYVAHNGANEISEIDTENWKIIRRFSTPNGPYNLEVSPDGVYLVVSYKGSGATGIWNLQTGKEMANIPNSRKVTHGVAITPDSKFAFVSVEGIGGEPGAVDIFDLKQSKLVATVETGKQAGGIVFWKTGN